MAKVAAFEAVAPDSNLFSSSQDSPLERQTY